MFSIAEPNNVGCLISSESFLGTSRNWSFSTQCLLIFQNSRSSTQGCQAMRRYLRCILQIGKRGLPCRRATITGQPGQGQPGLGTGTRDALAGLCHCSHNRRERDSVRTQNVLSQGRKPTQPLEKGCYFKLWLRAGKKSVFSVIVMVWQYFWSWPSQRSHRKKKSTTAHKQTKLHPHIKLRIRLFLF